MCDTHDDPSVIPGEGPTRRQFLNRLGWFTAGAAVLTTTGTRSLAAASPPRPASSSVLDWFGNSPQSMAMHIHSSFSEGRGSMRGQISEAASQGIKAMWFTDHDWRMSAFTYRNAYHFDSLEEAEDDRTWTWVSQVSGSVRNRDAGIVTDPVSPNDPSSTPGALSLSVQSKSGTATQRMYADTAGARHNMRGSISGQTWQLDVLPDVVDSGGYGELLLALSQLPAIGGRPDGQYFISYRFSPAAPARSTEGLLGIVNVQVVPGRWQTIEFDFVADIAALWPDIEPRDHSTRDVWLGVASTDGARAHFYYDYLRMSRAGTGGDRPLARQAQILDGLKALYPDVLVQQGQEVSFATHHFNAFGGKQHLYQYPSSGQMPPDADQMFCDLVHSWGSLVSINHPFGTETGSEGSSSGIPPDKLVRSRAWGADILEVGYRLRGYHTLEQHLALWDILSSNGVWITGNGVSDDHSSDVGVWRRMKNRFFTYAWTPECTTDQLLVGLKAGRVTCIELGGYLGELATSVEGNPMGSVSVQHSLKSRTLTVMATEMSDRFQIEVVQGPVDYSGSTTDRATTVAQLDKSAFGGSDMANVTLDTSSSSFVRVNLLDTQRNARVAFTNPIYLLREAPPQPVPPERQAPN